MLLTFLLSNKYGRLLSVANAGVRPAGSADPGGCISGSNLASSAQRHESGSVEGHWGNYNNSQNMLSNNLGGLAESQVGTPSLTLAQFQSNINNSLISAATTIRNATAVEWYPVNYDQNDVFLGWTNFPPNYSSCQ